jgi:pimeloyl-ACP methyl ester carboxylesterase
VYARDVRGRMRFVSDVVTGVRGGLAVLEAGAGGRPFLLVHGFTGAKEDFADQVAHLAERGWHVVVPDLPGHGASHPPDAVYGLDPFAEEVLALADDLGWDRFVLLGHSMGGVVAQHVAMHSPERLRALVLLDTTPDRVAVDEALVELACSVVDEGGMPALLEAQRAIGGGPLETAPGRRLREERPGWQDVQEAKLLACAPAMYVAMARALVGAADRAAALGRLRVPTLVLVGEHDQSFLEPSRSLAATIPGARFEIIPDAGHSPQVETPDAFTDALLRFLGEVAS